VKELRLAHPRQKKKKGGQGTAPDHERKKGRISTVAKKGKLGQSISSLRCQELIKFEGLPRKEEGKGEFRSRGGEETGRSRKEGYIACGKRGVCSFPLNRKGGKKKWWLGGGKRKGIRARNLSTEKKERAIPRVGNTLPLRGEVKAGNTNGGGGQDASTAGKERKNRVAQAFDERRIKRIFLGGGERWGKGRTAACRERTCSLRLPNLLL